MPTRRVVVMLSCLILVGFGPCRASQERTVREPLDVADLYREPTAAPTSSPTDADRRVVEFWTDDSEPSWVAVYEAVAERFMAFNPGVDVRIVPVNEASLSARMETAMEAGELPDIVRLGIERVATFADDDLLDVAAAEDVIDTIGQEAFRDSTLQMVRHPRTERHLAVPYDGWIQAIWYRTDLFDDLGLAPPTTWEAVRDAAQALSQSGVVEHGMVLPTDPQQNHVQQVFEQVAISNDAWPFDERGNLTMDSPRMVEALRWYDSLYPYSPAGAHYFPTARRMYLRDQAGQFFFSTYIMDDLIDGVPVEEGYPVQPASDGLADMTGFAAVLEGPNGSASYGQLVTLALLRGADPMASEVVEFYLTDGYQEVLTIDPFGKVPVLPEVMEEWRTSNEHFSAYSDETLDRVGNGYDTMQRWFLRPDYDAKERAVIGEIEGRLIIPRIIHEMTVLDRLTPEQAAARLQREVAALVREASR